MSLYAKLLFRLGLLPKNVRYRLSTNIRVVLQALDKTTATPIPGADVVILQMSGGPENSPTETLIGHTDSGGGMDATSEITWTYWWHEWRMNPEVAEPPAMRVLIRKTGFIERRIPFDIKAMSPVSGVYQLTLETVSLSQSS